MLFNMLYKHQQALVDLNPSRHLIAWQVRTGKTKAVIALAEKKGQSALFIVPKQLFDQWAIELNTSTLSGYQVITKEQFRKDAKSIRKYDTVVVDEAHHFSGMQSQMSKQLEKYLRFHDVKNIYLLTGTAYRSTPWNIYRLAVLLGHKLNYMEFKHQFFIERYLGRRVVYEPRPDCQEELADIVRSIGSIVRLEDCTDMPRDLPPEVELFKKTPAQIKLEEEILKKESNPLVRFSKFHQAASGFVLGNEFMAMKHVESAKDRRLLELIEEHGRVLVFCKYNAQLQRYADLCAESGIRVVVINGATRDIEGTRAVARDMKEGAVLIQMACSEGYDFSGYSVTIYPSLSYSYLDFEQSQGRTKHIEKKVPNFYIIMNTIDSADVPVWESIKEKRSFSEAVYARMHMV